MSGIRTGTGVFSGIDTNSLIDQLLQIDARPRTLVQRRVAQLQSQQAAYMDVNSRINAIKAAASAFRTASTFKLKNATSTDESTLTATASTTAATGSHTFRVHQLVTTQQMLSRGFADRNSTAVGAGSFTFESTRARLDDDISLADFNDGAGVARGRIVVTDSANHTATVDLSRATTVADVLDAINANGTALVTASVQGGHFVIRDNAGGNITIADATGYSTATSLGIAGTAAGTITGQTVYGLGSNTPLSALNDRNGVQVESDISLTAHNFTIAIAGTTNQTVDINIGDVYTTAALTKTGSAVSTVGGVIQRINAQLTAAGVTEVTAQINTTEGRIELVDSTGGSNTITVTEDDSTTAADLGLITTGAAGSVNGQRVLAGLNSVLGSSLNGGAGIAGDGALAFTLRDGTSFTANIDATQSLTDIFASIQAASGTLPGGAPRVTVALDAKGTGFTITDHTTGAGNLTILGTTANDTATSLGIATTPAGVASGTISSGNLQKQYMSAATLLSTLNNGQGVGTGKIRFTDSSGATALVDIGTDAKTLADVIDEINSVMSGTAGTTIRARINATGDGMEVYDTGTNTQRIKVEDTTGTVAAALKIRGEATGTGVGADNKLNGTLEQTVTFDADDTLDDMITKINDAGVGVDATVIRDGGGIAPFRISLSSERSGRSGRFIIDTNGFDMGLSTLSAGQDAIAFFGAGDVANAIAITSGTNLIDGIVPGVKIDLKAATDTPVTVTVTSNTAAIETAINEFITAFNDGVERINAFTKYDAETETRGVLLGDGTINELKGSLFRALNTPIKGFTNRYQRLTDIGIKVGKNGVLELDTDKLNNALATDPAAVEALFTRRVQTADTRIDLGNGNSANNPNAGNTFTELGAMGLIEQMADRYVNSITGTLVVRQKGIDTQIQAQNKRIEEMGVRLEARRAILERQFAVMESTIGKLQSQQSSINSIGG